ncbi:hypothetical protein BJ170DRAFT_192773 [Xylariales sp. AK1849]|nr:hypothetical protein BJ170DRAFT_192773 [Xylariales sp. AK1849]
MTGIQLHAALNGEFHYFPFLPKELRDMVWEYAALPSTPGIHFFQLVTESRFEDSRWKTRCRLDAPNAPGRSRWFRDNASSYLDTLGVWDACCESRQRLGKLFPRQQLTDESGPLLAIHDLISESDLPFESLKGWNDQGYSPCNCSYRDHGRSLTLGSNRALVLNLEEDIICLGLDLSGMRFHEGGNEIMDIQELRALKGHPARRLALEWNPKWNQDLPDGITPGESEVLCDIITKFTSAAFLPRLKCVYFIDHRITARKDPEMDSICCGTEVFRGRGKTFHEVRSGDDRWVVADEHPFVLLRDLAEERSSRRGMLDVESQGGSLSATDSVEVGSRQPKRDETCKFKVLACL